jgi:hypothetical protein
VQPRARLFHDERGEFGMLGWVVAFLILGALIAVPYVFLGRKDAEQAQQGSAVVARANDASAEVLLTTAYQGAKVYFAEQGTFVGYGPTQASAFDPQTSFDASPTARREHVSIRSADATSVVLVTEGGSGPLCVGLNGDVLSFGRADAANAAGCTGTAWS